jgi:hypothetical protein
MVDVGDGVTMEVPGNGDLLRGSGGSLGTVGTKKSVVKILTVYKLVRPVNGTVKSAGTSIIDNWGKS